MPYMQKELKALYAKLGDLRANAAAAADPGRKSVLQSEASQVAAKINKIKNSQEYKDSYK